MTRETVKEESLQSEVEHIIEESRMVLPGIQALFGFQLIAVFNQRFEADLTPVGQWIHLASLILVAVSIALIMAPAAYHRQAERGRVSQHLADYASRLITVAMLPLLIAISLEVGLVTLLVSESTAISAVTGGLLLCFFGWWWFAIPHLHKKRRTQPGG
jgi:cobalamin synthase